jgi:succinoglycan biosynthesis protein ExoV
VRLYYYPLRNFGDEPLNTWLWPQLLPTQLCPASKTLLVGIGSLLNEQLPVPPLKAIFSSGVGYGRALPDERWRVYCVRGPNSARALGLAPETAVTDGAVLVPTLGLIAPPKSLRASYMPHWRSDYHGDWRRVCQAAGIHYIDPTGRVENILDDIQRSQLLITEALHGAVVADALRVPWVPVKAYRHVLEFKWHDWCSSVDLHYQPARLPGLYQGPGVAEKLRALIAARLPARLAGAVSRLGQTLALPVYHLGLSRAAEALRRLPAAAHPLLSSDQAINRVTARLLEQLELLKRDIAQGQFNLGQN